MNKIFSNEGCVLVGWGTECIGAFLYRVGEGKKLLVYLHGVKASESFHTWSEGLVTLHTCET